MPPEQPAVSNGKTSPAPPQLTREDAAEAQGEPEEKLPLHEDVMQLARLGEVAPVQKLFEEGKVDAGFKDREGITPLHWAAINNHYAMCRFLLDKGVDVNAKGGEAVATPAMWAAQRCHYYVVHLLLQAGADTLLTDASGYNILHLATFDGNVFLLILLLHQNIQIDVTDLQGHTCLMWAAFKGYPACVDLFLRWGASVSAVDDNGFTALHWALVKGQTACVQKLIEYGSDRFAETSEGKTPTTVAVEMNNIHVWNRALNECGYDNGGNSKKFPLPYASFLRQRDSLNRFFFLYPFLVIFLSIYVLSGMVIYAAVPMTVLLVYVSQWTTQQVLPWAPSDMRHIHRTPYLAGVFAATLFWVGVRWLTKILPNTYSDRPFSNLFFAISFSVCTYFYILCMAEDPGYVPKAAGRSQQKAIMEELFSLWRFDEQNFCTQCMIRTPLRSKHCKRCKRCVAKHDHHCPWVYNCVGVNNIRHFLLYIISMEVGTVLFIRLVVDHLESLPPPSSSQCNVLSERICNTTLRDPFTVVLAIWAGLQLTWVTMLIIVQLVQISRATTTYENMRGSHMEHASAASEAITAALTTGTTSLDGGAQVGAPPGHRRAHGHGHGHAHGDGFFAQWKRLLGLDTFVATALGGPDGTRAQRRRNPFSRGCLSNCKDFWLDPEPYFGTGQVGKAMLGGRPVDYATMYDTPSRLRVAPRAGAAEDAAVYHSVGDGEGEV